MSKAIRWQLHFHEAKPDSQNPKHYRVDIYDEQDGTWSGITQLTAGDQPFVTDEDASDDFFCPVRTQTGTLQICTLKPDGQYITLDELLPANNIARPVMLLSISGNTETIEWQGFLSCEAYSQDYVGIPQTLSFPVNGILEAMASVQLNPATTSGLKRAYQHIYDALHEIEVQSGVTCFTHVRYSMTDWRIFQKYIDATVFFERKEYNNENSTTYIVSGLSCKDVLERLAAYMGWTVREDKREVLFERIGESLGMYQQTLSAFGSNFHPQGTPAAPIITRDLATDADWMGTGHQRSITAGAKSVEVVAKLEKYDIELSLPAFPFGDIETFYGQYRIGEWLYLIAAKNIAAYSNISYKFFKGTINLPRHIQTLDGEVTLQDLLGTMLIGGHSSYDEINIATASTPPFQAVVTGGAFLAQSAYETQQQSGHSPSDGLYVTWLPQGWNTPSHYNPETGYYVNTDVFEDLDAIFKIKNLLNVRIPNGYLKLTAGMTHIVYQYENFEDAGSFYKDSEWEDKLLIHIRIGNNYWNGNVWVQQPTKIWVDIDGSNFKKNWTPSTPVPETDGYLIPVNSPLSGDLEIGIYAPIDAMAHGYKMLAETFFSSLDLGFIENEDSTLSDRGENHYYRLLGTNFRDEIGINTDLASMLNNMPSPSLIMEDSTTPMKTLEYVGLGDVRPEVDLLNRLASYYGAARQRLELEVAHPTDAPLPMLKLNGIAPDNRVYLPLSESRDWQTDVCKLTCFELPEQPSES